MKKKEAFLIIIAAAFLVFVWIAISIYDSANSSTISQTLNVQISAINPSFDQKILNSLKTRQQVTAENVKEQVSPTPLVNQASPSATPKPSPTAAPIPTILISPSISPTTQPIITP